MEAREITFILESANETSTIMTSAETLGQLKADMRSNNIPFDGKEFFEGISRTTLTDDNSQLPKDVLYRGTTTNKLVFSLVTTNKKIRSGSDRKEIYTTIQNNNLQEAVKKFFGKNFTQVSTDSLMNFIEDSKNKVSAPKSAKVNNSQSKAPELKDTRSVEVLEKLIEYLDNNEVLSESEIYNLRTMLEGKKPIVKEAASKVGSPYTKEELAMMRR